MNLTTKNLVWLIGSKTVDQTDFSDQSQYFTYLMERAFDLFFEGYPEMIYRETEFSLYEISKQALTVLESDFKASKTTTPIRDLFRQMFRTKTAMIRLSELQQYDKNLFLQRIDRSDNRTPTRRTAAHRSAQCTAASVADFSEQRIHRVACGFGCQIHNGSQHRSAPIFCRNTGSANSIAAESRRRCYHEEIHGARYAHFGCAENCWCRVLWLLQHYPRSFGRHGIHHREHYLRCTRKRSDSFPDSEMIAEKKNK